MLKYSIHLVHTPLDPFLAIFNMHEDDNHYNCHGFLEENGSFNEHVLQEISGACVHTKPRGIEATCIVSGDRERPRVSSRSQCKQHKTWRWPENEAMNSNFVCTRFRIQSTTELNQKLTKSMPRRRSTRGIYTREKYPM